MHGKLAVGGPSIAPPVIQCTQQENQTFAMSSVHWLIKICAVLPWTVTVNSFHVDCSSIFEAKRDTTMHRHGLLSRSYHPRFYFYPILVIVTTTLGVGTYTQV